MAITDFFKQLWLPKCTSWLRKFCINFWDTVDFISLGHCTDLEKGNEMVLGCKTQYKLNPSSFLPPMIPKIFIENQTEPTQIDIQLCPSRNIPNYPLGWV